MPKISQTLLADLSSLLNTTEANEIVSKIHLKANDVNELVSNLDSAKTAQEVADAWGDIAAVLYKTYRVEHGNLKLNPKLRGGLITPLLNVVNSCVNEISALILDFPSVKDNPEPLANIFQLLYTTAEYHSVNDQIEEFKTWLKRAKEFRKLANLSQHLVNAGFLEFEASEISRRLTQKKPHGTIEECIEVFYQALEIYRINGITLDGFDSSARHTQNSLCVAISKLILGMVEKADAITPELMQQIKFESEKAFKLLETIEVPFLRTGVDVAEFHANYYENLSINEHVADPKRMSNMLSTRALVELCNNEINDGVMMTLVKALESMPKESIPQYANTLNRNANFLLAYAALIYNYANNTNKHPAAQVALEAIADHDYVKLANKFFAFNLSQDPNLTSKKSFAAQDIAKAEELMIKAVQLYVESFNITRGNAGESYGNVAEKFLLKISGHPACQTNSEAMVIVNNASKTKVSQEQSQSFTPQLSAHKAAGLAAPMICAGDAAVDLNISNPSGPKINI